MAEQKVGIIFSKNGCAAIQCSLVDLLSAQVLELSFHWSFAVLFISSKYFFVEKDLKNHLGFYFPLAPQTPSS